MKEQWMANKTPWHEIPHLESGEMHYINRETGELLNAPPSDGIFYKPFYDALKFQLINDNSYYINFNKLKKLNFSSRK